MHLPFDEAVKWVRTTGVDFWGWQSKEDWVEWLHQGEGMSQYIPSDPESYYGPGGRGGGRETGRLEYRRRKNEQSSRKCKWQERRTP